MFSTERPILIRGGRILDIDGDLDDPPKQDMLIRNGRIVAVGTAASEATGGEDIELIDAEEKLLIPGLVSAHYHSHDTLLRGMFEQLPLDAWMLYSAPGHSRATPEKRSRPGLHSARLSAF